MRRWILFIALLLVGSPSMAQETSSSSFRPPFPVGVRVGYTSWDDFGQVHFGAHAKLGDLFPNVQFMPVLEMGFGDDLTLVALAGDLTYRFTELFTYPWELYGGGSLALNHIQPGDLDADWQLGLSGLVGINKALGNGDELMLEARVGLLDSPDFKLTLGYTFF